MMRRFSIMPALVGATHTLTLDSKRVEIRLPKPRTSSDGKPNKDEISCNSWRKVDGVDVPTQYQVHSADVYVDANASIDVPDRALEKPPVQYEAFSRAQRDEVEALVARQRLQAERSLQYWLSVLRWKSRIPYLCEPDVDREESGWSTRLLDAGTQHSFWVETAVICLPEQKPISEEAWQQVQSALDKGEGPPAWVSFMFDAIQRLNTGDVTGAILSAATGIEVVLRGAVSRHLKGEDSHDSIVGTLLDLANLRTILNHRKKMRFWTAEWDTICNVSRVNELMNARDAIMHRADVSVIRNQDWKTLIDGLISFAYFAEDQFAVPASLFPKR